VSSTDSERTSRSTEEFNREAKNVSRPLWFLGWNPKFTIPGGIVLGAIIGTQFGGPFLLGFLGLFVGIGGWYAGTREVNAKYKDVRDGFLTDARNAAGGMLGMGGEVNTYTLERESGSAPLVESHREYTPISLIIGESSVAIHDEAELEMPTLDAYIGESTQEFYYDQIGSVNYDEPHLQLKTSDGELLQFASSRRPDDALYELQERIREHKS